MKTMNTRKSKYSESNKSSYENVKHGSMILSICYTGKLVLLQRGDKEGALLKGDELGQASRANASRLESTRKYVTTHQIHTWRHRHKQSKNDRGPSLTNKKIPKWYFETE